MYENDYSSPKQAVIGVHRKIRKCLLISSEYRHFSSFLQIDVRKKIEKTFFLFAFQAYEDKLLRVSKGMILYFMLGGFNNESKR